MAAADGAHQGDDRRDAGGQGHHGTEAGVVGEDQAWDVQGRCRTGVC